MSQISKELLSELQEAKQTMQAVQNELGLMAIAESTKPELLARYKEMQAQIRKASEKIQEEHGAGNLDMETGEFTPSEEVPLSDTVAE
tara:strand:+ start:382 stop:645 length:264 start_codon:yes stop_codon:yes gene_type:complete